MPCAIGGLVRVDGGESWGGVEEGEEVVGRRLGWSLLFGVGRGNRIGRGEGRRRIDVAAVPARWGREKGMR